MEKLVSVFINAYNSENFILETVNSVLNQTHKNIQLIVIDDCSTDNTYELLKTVNDDRLEIYKNDINMGISYTCNRGISFCRGEYIGHTDSDDVWVPDKIEKQLRFLEENPEYGACFSYVDIIDNYGNICEKSEPDFKKIFSAENMPQAEMFRYFIENPNRICHSTMLARSQIMKIVGYHRLSTKFLHDYDYWLRMLSICPIYILQEPLIKYRVHNSNNSSMNEEKWIAHDNELLYIIDDAIENCPDELFLRAFEDKLHIKGKHTHEEVELEKAFYSIDNIYRFKDNPILGINRLMRLFDSDEKYTKLAINKFGFKLKDLNLLQTNRLYSDTNLINNQKNIIDKQKGVIDDLLNAKQKNDADFKHLEKILSDKDADFKHLEKILSDKDAEIKTLGDLVLTEKNNSSLLQNNINSLQSELSNLNNSYNQILNSFSWKITSPIRKIVKIFRKH